MNISETVLDAEALSPLDAMAAQVLDAIAPRLPGGVASLDAIDQAVHEWQHSGTPPTVESVDQDDLVYAFGITWGNAVVRTHGWQWVDLTFHEFDDWEGRAVVSPDRALMILPFAHIYECLEGSDEVKISFSLAVIGTDVIPTLDPNGYVNLVHNIQRIVPRG
ncbi:hypothetical protein [Pseudomonas mangiferae]|uniref:DUF3806 domain-containing protein n=1 Tax=Pseudomonas mangiferae TaxID=2593654 RepID=A0A553H3W0_9PSED|nr:hypothetical protein [Pseudomonas mangiferae]TRX76417.1 hypothetical protein FM069_04315 [Pseudomonas mangiferae]